MRPKGRMVFLYYFEPVNHICIDGQFLEENQPAFLANNRSYRYGYGLFETMRLHRHSILFEDLHFDRLFSGARLLKLHPSPFNFREDLIRDIKKLSDLNHCSDSARVRLSISAGEGGPFDANEKLHWLIECQPFESFSPINTAGLLIDIFPDARKQADVFSHLKSANFLPYVMAAQFARERKLDDCLVLNENSAIADASTANIFLINDGHLLTPALSEACIDGVARKYLLNQSINGFLQIKNTRLRIEETRIDIEELMEAEEIFLTNALHGIRWVHQFRENKYPSVLSEQIYQQFFQPLYS